MRLQAPRVILPLCLISVTVLAACSGGSGGGGGTGPVVPPPGPAPGPAPSSLSESLGMLGVDTAQTPRLALDAEMLSENYTPVGTRWSPDQPSEVVLAGVRHSGASGPDIAWLQDGSGLSSSQALPRLATEDDASFANEAVSSVHGYAAKRAFAAADVDADGREELVAVRAGSGMLTLSLWEDTVDVGAPQETPARVDYAIASAVGVQQVALVAGDFDGDTFDELLVGFTTVHGAVLAVYDRDGTEPFTQVAGSERSLMPTTGSTEFSLVLASGNLDQDPGFEYAYVLNEFLNDVSGATTFAVRDDHDASWLQLAGGPIVVDGFTAKVASIAIGDVDGDTLDEVVLGGLYEFGSGCAPSRYIGLALDDKVQGLQPIAGHIRNTNWSECNSVGYVCEFAHVALLDIDKDRRAEVLLNEHVFELDSTLAGSPWREKLDDNGAPIRLPQDAFFEDSTTPQFTRATSVIVAGDVNADRYDDILVFRQGIDEVRVFTPRLEAGGGITLQEAAPLVTGVGSAAGFACNPIIVPIDTDDDGTSIVRTEAAHEVIFSQPVVLAVLASPPTVADIAQNYEECRTTFGNTQSSSSENERSLSVETSVSVGISVQNDLTQSGLELKNTLTQRATVATGDSYTLSETVEYTSGQLEDTVVFACLPLDRYTYRVVRSPDATLLDREVTIDLPRRPVVLQVERGYYNERVFGNAPIIDDAVLEHAIGSVASYPDVARRNELMQQFDGAATNPVSVGQGVGFTAVTLSIAEAQNLQLAYETGFEVSLEVTGLGVLAGFSVGGSAGTSLRTMIGSETTYGGSVGSIDGAQFADNFYQWGLFTYYYDDPLSGQSFQVLNYWVQ